MPPFPQIRSPQRNTLHPSPLPSPAEPRTDYKTQRPLPEDLSITHVTTSTLPAYRRLITLLLPIRYTEKFYKDSISNPTPSSLALCALWHETPRPGKRKVESLNNEMPLSASATDGTGAKVVGGIQCRLEPIPCQPPTTSPNTSPTASAVPPPPHQQPHNLYMQTLAVLSPYRHLGIAAALLDAIIRTTLTHCPEQNMNVKEIYAHVWEANEEALEWYVKRGFEVGDEVVEGYYRKLRPSGARIVRKRMGVGDWVGVLGGWEGGTTGKEGNGCV